MLPEVRIGGQHGLQPVGLTHQHQHPLGILFDILQPVNQGADDALLCIVVVVLLNTVEFVGVLKDQRSALGTIDGREHIFILTVDGGRSDLGHTRGPDFIGVQQAQTFI